MSVKEQIRERMGATFDRWHFVAHQMTGQRSNYAYVMMHVVERLHESGGESIQITIPEWKATHGFAKDLVGNASMVLYQLGVIYENHGRTTWRIDAKKFWAAFEAAFALVFPELEDGDDGTSGGAGETHIAGETHVTESDTEGKPDSQDAGDPPLIDRIDVNNETGVSGEFFARWRLRLGLPENHLLERMIAAAAKLGIAAAKSVIQRCMDNYSPRKWAYIAKSLDKEVFDLTQPRQLKLMPVDSPLKSAKPSFDVKAAFNDGLNPAIEAPALPPEPMTRIVRRPVATSGKHAEAWRMAYDQMRLQDKNRFDQYLQDAQFVGYQDGMFLIETISEPMRDTLQNRLYRWIEKVVSSVWGQAAKLQFVTAQRVAVAS